MLRDTPLLPQSEGQTNWPEPANGRSSPPECAPINPPVDRINLALFLARGIETKSNTLYDGLRLGNAFFTAFLAAIHLP